MPSVVEWYQSKRKGGKFMNLREKLQNIKDEYMLYEYIDRSPKVVGEKKELNAPAAAFKEKCWIKFMRENKLCLRF